jgi:hypothetical protein
MCSGKRTLVILRRHKVKKLSTMIASLIVLGICLPAYSQSQATDANILVYKVSMSGKALTADGIESGTIRGYVVAEVDVASTNCNFIAYGKDDAGNKFQKSWDSYIDRELQDSCIGVYFADTATGGNSICGNLIGNKAKEMDIGAADEALIAKSLTGHFLLWVNPLTLDDLLGSGKISLKLDNRLTKEYNGEGKDRIAAAIAVQEYLEEKGYVP